MGRNFRYMSSEQFFAKLQDYKSIFKDNKSSICQPLNRDGFQRLLGEDHKAFRGTTAHKYENYYIIFSKNKGICLVISTGSHNDFCNFKIQDNSNGEFLTFGILKNRFPNVAKFLRKYWIDQIIENDNATFSAIHFINNVIQERCEELEDDIIKYANLESLLEYIQIFIRKPWKPAEARILGNAYTSVRYAKNIIKGPWRSAEILIASEPFAAIQYAKTVLHDRFPLAEKNIRKHSRSRDDYEFFLLSLGYNRKESKI